MVKKNVRNKSFLEKQRNNKIEFIKNLKDIKCLNPQDYRTFDSYLDFECPNGHKTTMRYETLSQKIHHKKGLCSVCSKKEVAKRRFYKCLPRRINFIENLGLRFIEFIQLDSNNGFNRPNIDYKISCPEGHIFIRKGMHLEEMHGCPQCKPKSIIEEKIRQLLKFIFKVDFLNIRPHVFKKDRKSSLEIDCLSISKLPLSNGKTSFVGIEVDGGQHKIFNKHYHRTRKRYNDMKRRDQEKEKLCAQNNILLIRVGIDGKDYSNLNRLTNKLILLLKENKIKIPKRIDFSKFKLDNTLSKRKRKKFLGRIINHGYSIIKETDNEIIAKCEFNHKTIFTEKDDKCSHMKRCLECGKNKHLNARLKRKSRVYFKIKKMVEEKGGILNTKEKDFIKQGPRTRINVTCPIHDHSWDLYVSNFYKGKWCRLCGHDSAREKQLKNHENRVLNGISMRKHTDEEILKVAKKYKDLNTFVKNDPNFYALARQYEIDISFLKRIKPKIIKKS